jgi:hypothetical protein
MSDQQATEIERALATHSQDERVIRLLDICVGRILKKDSRRGNDWTQQYKPESVDHIVEWLALACSEDAHWLGNMTPDGKPKKLLKFSTVQDVVREADEFFRKRTANVPKAADASGSDEQTVFPLDGGYRIVRMLSTTALDREGSLMGHCVGSGGYDSALKADREMFFSLRDPRNRPHVTMQVRIVDKKVIQARGKQNAYPVAKYAKMIAVFAKQEGFDLSGEKVGLAQLRTPAGDVLDPENLPEDRVVLAAPVGGWSYLNLGEQGIERWPRVVEVFGNVRMEFEANDGPEEIIVHGRLKIVGIEKAARIRSITADDLDIADTRITHLPASTTISGSLLAMGSHLTQLPDTLRLSGTLDIRKTHVSVLPEGCTCGELLAQNSKLTALPGSLVVSNDINIRDTAINGLPDGLSCTSLFASGSKLEGLPKGFSVEGTIDLRDTEMEVLPEELACSVLMLAGSKVKVLGRGTSIKADLLAAGSNLRILPRDLHVPGRLDLSDSKIRTLPRGLICGDLDISRTRVTKLPSNMSVWGSLTVVDGSLTTLGDHEEFEMLDIRGCPIRELPDHFLVHGKLDLSRLPYPVSLAGLVTNSEIRADGTTISKFPAKIELQGGLYLSGATLQVPLPDGLICAELLLDDATVEELPRRMSVGNWISAACSTIRRIHDLSGVYGIVDLTGTLIDELPEGLVVPGSLWIENTDIRHLPSGLRIGNDLRAARSRVQSLASDIVIGRSANFTGTAVTQEMILSARLVVGNVFDLKGGWVSGYEPMEEIAVGFEYRVCHMVGRAVAKLKQMLRPQTR